MQLEILRFMSLTLLITLLFVSLLHIGKVVDAITPKDKLLSPLVEVSLYASVGALVALVLGVSATVLNFQGS